MWFVQTFCRMIRISLSSILTRMNTVLKNQWPITSNITCLKNFFYCEWITAHFNWNVHPKGIFTNFFSTHFNNSWLNLFHWFHETVEENSILTFLYLVEMIKTLDSTKYSLPGSSTLVLIETMSYCYNTWHFFYQRYFDFIWDSEYLFLNVISFFFSSFFPWTIGISSFVDKYGWLTMGNSSVLKCIFQIQWSNKLNDRKKEVKKTRSLNWRQWFSHSSDSSIKMDKLRIFPSSYFRFFLLEIELEAIKWNLPLIVNR